ncbi:MAG: D-serine ammonia-lyase, partial [Ancrocorticia sp.]
VDDELYRLIALLHQTEGIDVEPSAAASLVGAVRVTGASGYLDRLGLTEKTMANANHIAWCTGGSMVPKGEMEAYITKGAELDID